MDDLLPYYERELQYLRRYSNDFARRHPKTARRLGVTAEQAEDPNVERLIESVAFLNARISKKLEDDYPEFTDALLEVLYPHYLRPFPACSIAQVSGGSATDQLTKPFVIPRGTEMKSLPVRGVPCIFRTAYEVVLAPIRIVDAHFLPVALAPSATVLPASATGVVSITIESTAAQFDLTGLALEHLRVHLHGDQPLVSTLTDCLFLHTVAAYVEPERQGHWIQLPSIPIAEAGFDEADALIDYPARAHPAYRLLTEYFAFADKFQFIDLDCSAMTRAAGPCRRLTLHLVMKDVRGDSHAARLLDTLAAHHLRLFCTPVVNLFETRADPIQWSHQASSYPVVVDGRDAFAYEVYSIDTVHQVRKLGNEEAVTELRPFYSLHHGEQAQTGHYWFARRDERVAQKSPGYETEIGVVDLDFNPTAPHVDTLSLKVTATNRDLPERLSIGLDGGDLSMGEEDLVGRISLLMRPTATTRFDRRQAAHWRIISHLSLNHLSLTKHGAATLKEMLKLYDQRHTAVSARHIEGIADLEVEESTQWMAGKPFPTFVRGVLIRIVLDETHFTGVSLYTFISLIDRFFALYVHINSFTQLLVVSKQTGREIVRCKPRSGEIFLV
jgi:type VI secretion system protein ImpG